MPSFGTVALPDYNSPLFDLASTEKNINTINAGTLANQLASNTLDSNTQIAANQAQSGSLANQFAGQKNPLEIIQLRQQLGIDPSPALDKLMTLYNGGGQPSPGTVPPASAPGTSAPASGSFTDQLGASESPGPAVVNPGGYSGQFQFGAARLADPGVGVYTPAPGENLKANSWQGTFNIPGFPDVKTHADFLASPDAQRAAFGLHVADIDNAIAQTPGATSYNQNGLRAVAHLGGVAGMQRFVSSGGLYNPADANGTHLSDYYAKFSQGGPRALQASFGHPAGPPAGYGVSLAPDGSAPAAVPVQIASLNPASGVPTAQPISPAPAAAPADSTAAGQQPSAADLIYRDSGGRIDFRNDPIYNGRAGSVPIASGATPASGQTEAGTGSVDDVMARLRAAQASGAALPGPAIPNQNPLLDSVPGGAVSSPPTNQLMPAASAAPPPGAAVQPTAPAGAAAAAPPPSAPGGIGGTGVPMNQLMPAASAQPPSAAPGTGMNSPQVQAAQGLLRRATQIELAAAATPNDPRVKAAAAAMAADMRNQAAVIMQADSVAIDPNTGLQTHTLTGKVDSAATPGLNYTADPAHPGLYTSPGAKPVFAPVPRVTKVEGAGGTILTQPGSPDRVIPYGGRIEQVAAYKSDLPKVELLTAAAQSAQASMPRLNEMADLASQLATGGAAPELRAKAAAILEQSGVPTETIKEFTGMPGGAAAQLFTKLAISTAGAAAKADVGANNGIQSTQLYQSANPGMNLLPDANKRVTNMMRVSAQQIQDYAQAALQHFGTNETALLSGGNYAPLTAFNRAWLAQSNPQVGAAAIGILNGDPFASWSAKITPAEGLRAAAMAARVDPAVVVPLKGGGTRRASEILGNAAPGAN